MNELNIAKSLYALFETLSKETQQAFLQELLQKNQQELEDLLFYFACKEEHDKNDFLSENETKQFISEGLDNHSTTKSPNVNSLFGLISSPVDGLEFQNAMREE